MDIKNTFLKNLYSKFNEIYPIDESIFCDLKEHFEFEVLNPLDYYSNVNEFAKKISFVCLGVLRIFHLDENGNEWNKHFFIENDFFAANSNQNNKTSTAVQSLTKVNLFSIKIDTFLSLSKKFEYIEVFVNNLLSSVLEKEKEKGLMLLSYNGNEKYTHFLKTFPNLENRIQHYHIASYLGITPTQLSRIRKKRIYQQM